MNPQTKNRIFIISLLLFVLMVVGMVNAQEMAPTATETSTSASPAPQGYLTGPQAGDALDIALNYLRANKELYGLTETDLADVRVSDRYVSQDTGVTHIYLVQRLNGIEVFNGLINVNVMEDGRILSIGNRFYPDLATAVKDTTPAISATDAVQTAASHLNLAITEPLTTLSAANSPDQATVLSKGGISQNDIEVKLVYDTSGKTPQLAWNAIIYQNDSLHWWNIRVDANTGEVLSQNDWVVQDHWGTTETAETTTATQSRTGEQVVFSPTPVADGSSYQVYQIPIESPIHSSPPSPADGRTVQAQPADAVGSPFGWHDTNGASGAESTLTIGNNVQAYLDLGNDNTPSIPGDFPADGGAGLDFLFPLDLTQAPSAYRPAAVTNLFYWNNLMHDVPYRYGFDAVAGNFQENNYGLGGLGSDSVNAEAQDGGGTNNANFATPADGGNPRMQMYLWNLTTPGRDGDLDNGIIAHEYGHGISNRLVGGPSNVSCLGNSEQMGEGWSDWQSVMLTMRTGDTATTNRGVGTYALGQATNGVGIRPAPYNTDMGVNGYTYSNLPGMAVPHGVGFVWATMLWEVNWALIDEYGFNQDMYRPVGGSWTALSGNQLAYQLVSDGMKLAACSPGFVDSRDAILAADVALTGGVNQCTIWAAFAKRGLGFSASQGSNTSTSDGTAAFDMPPACLTLDVNPTTQNICQGQTATYTVGVGTSFTAPVSMSAVGNPAPTTATFTPNPVMSVPSSTDLTIGNTASAPAGNYTITITGNDGSVSDNADVDLNIYAGDPGTAPTLLAPADGSTSIGTAPTLTWAAVADATGYHLQVATDAGFSNIVYEADEPTTSHAVSGLSANTAYYWRVAAMNACGTGTYAAPFSFTTASIYCATPNAPLPDDPDQSFSLVIGDSGEILDLNLSINASHTWVGDTIFTLVHQGTGTSVTVIDRPGRTGSGAGCANDNIDVLLDDEGVDGPVENQCATNPALFGNPTPNNPLSAFDGEDLSGTWVLQYIDAAGADTGTLHEWCLVPDVDFVTYSIALTKTVGTDPNTCATTDSITLPPGGGDVTYCYLVTNTGEAALNTHDLVDDQLGSILSNFPYVLNPGASAYLTVTTTIVTNTVNMATWTADDGTNSATDTDSATVFVQHYLPDIETDASVSSTQATDTVVTQTLQITNAGEVTGAIALAGGGGSDLAWNIQENGGTAVSSLITGNSVLVGGCAGDIPWLSVTPTAGTTALFNTSDVSVVFNSTGLTAGSYTGALCVNSNDLDEPVVTIPVTLSVTAPTYGVVLSGDDAASGDVGTTVTYTLHLTNTGDVADTFDLSISGNSWATVLSDSSIILNAGETGSFTASVDIPGGASNGDTDTATVTATSQSDGAATDSADLTTTAVFNAVYGVELSADDAASGLVGATVTYTLHITNTGNTSDNFDLTISGNGWTTTLPAGSIALNAGESTTFTTAVDIPGGAVNGDTDTVTVTATSQTDGAATDSADLTTTAVLNAVYGVELSTDDASSGDVGTTVTYTLHLTNTGNVADTFDVTISGNGWSTTLSDSSITLNPGTNGSFTVVVEVPAGANNGDTDAVTVTATSQTDGTAVDSAVLTTTAVAPISTGYTAYLPFVTKP